MNNKAHPSPDPQSTQGLAYYFAKFNPLTLRKRGRRAKAIFALSLVCFFWGTTWIASKEGVRHMPALQLAGIRQFAGGFLYLGFFLFKGTSFPKGREWRHVLILTLLNFVLSNALSTWGIQYISAGLGAIIGAIFPLWLVIIAYAGGQAKPVNRSIIGLLLGFTGICVIFYEHLNDFFDPGFRLGILLSLASTWSWAFGTLYTKKQAALFNPYLSLGIQMFISGILLQVVSGITGLSIHITEIPWQAWSSIAYLVLFGSVISFVAFLYALQHLPTEQSSLYAYVNPIVAVLCGWLLFEEKLTGFIIFGALITLYGVYLVNRSVVQQKEIQ